MTQNLRCILPPYRHRDLQSLKDWLALETMKAEPSLSDTTWAPCASPEALGGHVGMVVGVYSARTKEDGNWAFTSEAKCKQIPKQLKITRRN